MAHYRIALSLAPDNAEANSVYGLMLLQLNRLDEAATPLRRAAELDPSQPEARLNLAELHVRQGDVPGAMGIVEALAAERPELWWIWDRLGELKARVGRFAEAAANFHRAVEQRPDDASLLFRWARAMFDSGSPAQAKAILDRAARLISGSEAIYRLYAEIHEAGSDWDNLGRTAQSWLRAQPQNPLPWMYVAVAQWESGYLVQAMQSYRAFLDRGGKNASNLATYGRLCLTAHAYAEASLALDEAERLDPECGHMLSGKASLSMFHARFEEAAAYARKAVRSDPQDASAFKVLVQVSDGHIAPNELDQLERLSENAALRIQDRIAASFALADCLDAKGDVDAAFAAYVRANGLGVERARREGLGYDRGLRQRQIDRLISAFPAASRESRIGTRPTPVFIVGMPRSGTTLIESILGAHSGVLACGERQAMRSIMQEFLASAPAVSVSGISESTRRRWRESFWRELPEPHRFVAVTDKNPWNFDALGMIFELFPHARVIHLRRDPVETGLSIFRNEFPKFVSFTNRLEDIGHYYAEYARLMSHWQETLGDRFLTIQYEDIVADFESLAPRIVRYCDLEWEAACGSFWTSPRVVSTISTVQVRQPPRLAGRRDRYARHLAPLVSALSQAGVGLRSGAPSSDRAI